MQLREAAILAGLYAQALKDISDTVDAFEAEKTAHLETRGQLKAANELIEDLRSKQPIPQLAEPIMKIVGGQDA